MFFTSSSAEVKKWVDENGNIHYGDVAPNENAKKAKLYNIKPKYLSKDTYESKLQEEKVRKLQTQFDEAIIQIKSGDLSYEPIAQFVLVELRKANENISTKLAQLDNAILQGTMNSAKFLEQKKHAEEEVRNSRKRSEELQAAIKNRERSQRQKESLEDQLESWEISQKYEAERQKSRKQKAVLTWASLLIVTCLSLLVFSILKASKEMPMKPKKMPEKKILPAFLLCFFFGFLGFHRFYAGKIITGLLQLFTLGGFGIWAIIDFIMIIIGAFTDKEGNEITQWT